MVLVISQGSFALIVQQIENGFQFNFVTESMHIKKGKSNQPYSRLMETICILHKVNSSNFLCTTFT